jgi:hypothetical protein
MQNLKIISPSLHGILDYSVDITLIIVPIIFNFIGISNTVFWIPVAIGISNFIYSLFTDYSKSLVQLIPMRLHLMFDLLAGAILFALAVIIPMDGFVQLFYIIMGAGIFLATTFTSSK